MILPIRVDVRRTNTKVQTTQTAGLLCVRDLDIGSPNRAAPFVAAKDQVGDQNIYSAMKCVKMARIILGGNLDKPIDSC